MSEAQLAEVPEPSEPMTWKQICELYPDEWVSLVEIDSVNDRDFEFRSARVIAHGKSRKEPILHIRAVWARYREIGHFYTGRIPATLNPLLFV